MNDLKYEIASVLPYEEYFTPVAAGSVSLFVRDTTLGGAYHNHMTVYGRADTMARRFSGIRYQPVTPSMPILFGQEAGYLRALVDEIRKRPTGMIEVHNNVEAFFTLAKNFPNTPITIYFHQDPLTIKGAKTPKQRWKILSRADAVYCCSDYIRRRFLTGLEAGRHSHVHVVHEYADQKQRRKKEPYIVYVGPLDKEKGAMELALAAQTLLPHFPQWRIVFVGANRPGRKTDNAYARNVYNVLKTLGPQAKFLGHQPHKNVIELFSRASIAVEPALVPDAKGRTAIEAIVAGCALVTSGHGCLSEIAGQAGLLVSPVTAEGLALSLQGLMEDPESLHGIQTMCYEYGQQFSLQRGLPYFDSLRYALLAHAYGG